VVEEIYITPSKSPEDVKYLLDESYFRVINDGLIQQIKPFEIEDGNYFVGINHSYRGVKFTEFRINFSGRWYFKDKQGESMKISGVRLGKKYYNMNYLLIIAIITAWILSFFLILRAFALQIYERISIKKMIREFERFKKIQDESEHPIRSVKVVKKGLGLTIKYTLLILTLVIFIVTATASTLSFIALRNGTINLSKEMKERAELAMSSYWSGIRNNFELEEEHFLNVDLTKMAPQTVTDIAFAMFKNERSNQDYIEYGQTEKLFLDAITNLDTIDKEGKDEIIKTLIKSDKIDEIIKDLIKSPETYNNETYFFPKFEPSNVEKKYLIFRPVIVYEDLQKKDRKIYAGYVVFGYSFERIIQTIDDERKFLIRITLIVTLIALIISLFGAIFLATTTIRPIKLISKHVNLITTMEDYETLEGTADEKIIINSKDEISILASAINEMTHKLIEKAKADKQLLLGKEIQKKFIPLEPHSTDKIDIYGFYEGAKGVSGDYFDYKKIDDDHYAFIMCDVAGKAVPAALIMVQISTIFNAFVSSFKSGKDKIETVGVVTQINDTVAERGFVGRFAAILVLILNVKTGRLLLTNAGCTQLLVYRASLGKTEWIKLDPDSGAAGVFPSYMLPNPYKQEKHMMNKGDIMFLFTDGIEESRNGKTYLNENNEETPEEFGLKRVEEVINATVDKTPKSIIDSIIKTENKFRGNLEQYDDLTLLAVQRL